MISNNILAGSGLSTFLTYNKNSTEGRAKYFDRNKILKRLELEKFLNNIIRTFKFGYWQIFLTLLYFGTKYSILKTGIQIKLKFIYDHLHIFFTRSLVWPSGIENRTAGDSTNVAPSADLHALQLAHPLNLAKGEWSKLIKSKKLSKCVIFKTNGIFW